SEFKSPHGIFIKSCREDHCRFVIEMLKHLQARQLRHLHIEKDQIGTQFIEQTNRLTSIISFAYEFDPIGFSQKVSQRLPGEWFVFDNYRASYFFAFAAFHLPLNSSSGRRTIEANPCAGDVSIRN